MAIEISRNIFHSDDFFHLHMSHMRDGNREWWKVVTRTKGSRHIRQKHFPVREHALMYAENLLNLVCVRV